jgi:hypothetical protein
MGLPAFPYKLSPNRRYFVDQGEAPRRLTLDVFFTALHHLSPAERTAYLKWLAAGGFLAVRVMLLVHPNAHFGAAKNEPNDWDNDPPWTGTAFATPNATYFNKYVAFINEAATYGISVFLDHTYVGFPGSGEGCENEVSAAANADLDTWGAFIGNTFNQDNVFLLHFGDQRCTGTLLTKFKRIIDAIRAVTKKHFASAELNNPDDHAYAQTGIVYDPDRSTGDMHFDFWYGIGPSLNGLLYQTARDAYDHSPTTPHGPGEIAYFNNSWNPFPDRESLRRLHQMAAMGGGVIAFHSHGSDDRFFALGAGKAMLSLDAPETLDMIRSNRFWEMVPSWHLMLPTGTGADHAGINLVASTNTEDSSFIASCVASDGSSMVAHYPNTRSSGGSFSLNFTRLAPGRSFRAWWYDLTSGRIVYEQGGAYVFTNASSSQSFTTPGNNSIGATDWNLCIDAAPYGFSARGPSRSPAVGPSGMGGSRMCAG